MNQTENIFTKIPVINSDLPISIFLRVPTVKFALFIISHSEKSFFD